MEPFVKILFLHAMLVVLGHSVIVVSSKRKPPPLLLSLALAYGLGTGLISVWMFILGVCNISFKVGAINYPLGILAILLYILSLKHMKAPQTQNNTRPLDSSLFTNLSLIFGIYILVHVGYVFWQSFNVPIFQWDAFSTHGFNAKVLYFEQSLKYLKNQPHGWLNLNLGSWDHQYVKTMLPFYFLSFLIIQYHFLNMFASKQWSLFGLVLLVSSPFFVYHSTVVYHDFIFLFYNITAVLLLLMWNREKSNVYLLSASVFAGLAGFTKLVGAVFLLIHVFLLIIMLSSSKNYSFFDKFKNFMKFCIPSFSICLAFHIYKYFSAGVQLAQKTKAIGGFDLFKLRFNVSLDLLSKLGDVLHKFFDNLLLSNNWNILWLIFFLSLFKLKEIKLTTEIKLLLLALGLFFSIYIAGATLTQHYYWVVKTNTVLSRCILHFFPLAPTLIILINFSDKSGKCK